jgi:hypothetical protein
MPSSARQREIGRQGKTVPEIGKGFLPILQDQYALIGVFAFSKTTILNGIFDAAFVERGD